MRLLVDSHSIPSENSLLRLLTLQLSPVISVSLGLNVIKRRRKVDIHVSINDANSVVLILGRDLQYIDLKLIIEDLYADGIALMQTCEIPKLIL